MEIAKVRSQREETEKQLKEKKFSSSKTQKRVKKVQEEVKVNFVYCNLPCVENEHLTKYFRLSFFLDYIFTDTRLVH